MTPNVVVGTRHWLGEAWHHIDIDPTPLADHQGRLHPVDTVCDAAAIPLPDASFTHLFSSECIEHFSWRRTGAVIKEWARLLAPGGTMRVETPDFGAAAAQLLSQDTLEHHLAMQQIFYAEQLNAYDYHYAGLTHLTLPHFFTLAGVAVTEVARGPECGWLRVDGEKHA